MVEYDDDGNEIEETGESDETLERPSVEDFMALQTKVMQSDELNAKLAAMVADPDVAALLDAKDKGEAIRLITGGKKDEGADSALPADAELDGMSNADSLRLMLERVTGVVAKAVATGNEALSERLEVLETDRSSGRKKDIETEVKGLMQKYPDLAEYAEDIKKLVSENGLKVEEAYITSRMRKGRGFPMVATATERSNGITMRETKVKDAPARFGAQGFSQDLAEVVDRLLIDGT